MIIVAIADEKGHGQEADECEGKIRTREKIRKKQQPCTQERFE
jgi:hypothetical protein